jgi:hypothetical protein
MKLFYKGKDGGSESNVTGYWLIEHKNLFSIALLRFDKGSREAFHSHAFNCFSIILNGKLLEEFLDGRTRTLLPFWKAFFWTWAPKVFWPFVTKKTDFHKVHGLADKTWVLTFRGPWEKNWQEYLPKQDKFVTLTNGRKIVEEKL